MPNDTTPQPAAPVRPGARPAPAAGHTSSSTTTQPVVLTGSGAILKSLEHLGVTDVFGLPGGAIIPF